MKKQHIERKIAKLDTLPSFKVFAGALKAAFDSNESRDYRDILATLSKDPSLTARIIATANSAVYYGAEPVISIKDAAHRLGMTKLKALIMGHCLSSKLNTANCPSFEKKRYWLSAMLTAVCASHIADNVQCAELVTNEAYCIGLLHNIGVLILVLVVPDLMQAVFTKENNICTREHEVFDGMDHYTAAGLLLSQWKMPKRLVSIISNCNVNNYQGAESASVTLIKTAKQFVRTGFSEDNLLRIKEDPLQKISQAYSKDKSWITEFAGFL